MAGFRIIGRLLLAAAVLVPHVVNADVIDFNSAATGIFTTDYFEDGYVMTSEIGHYHISVSSNGTNAVTIDAVGDTDDTIRFAVDGGGLFDLLSLDVLDTGDEENGGTLTASNGSIMMLGAAALGHVIFDASWAGVEWIELTISDANEEWATIDNIELVKVPEPATVAIDIKPGSDPNCFNINGHGVIPVAILGSDTFDVANIDQYSLSFGGLDVRVRGKKGPLCGLEDVNLDGFYDLVCHFEDNTDYWESGEDYATLTGVLLDGTEIEGTDSICIVP